MFNSNKLKNMTEESSPLHLQEIINNLKKKEEYRNDGVITKLITVLESHHVNLPKPFVRGKTCSNCQHCMHCKTVRCPNCHLVQRERKREPRGKKGPPPLLATSF